MSELYDNKDEEKPRLGRPRGHFNPDIDWALAESLFVFGNEVEPGEDGDVTFPSLAQIGERIGCTKGNVQQRAKRYDWATKRLKALTAKGLAPPAATIGKPGVGAVVEGPPPAPRRRRTKEEVLNDYIDRWDRSMKKGKVRFDCVADLDKAVRLLAFVRGEADSRKATHTVISLEVLQRRHRETRDVIDTVGEEVTGVIHGGGEGYSLEGEEAHDPVTETPRLALPPPRMGWEVAAARAAASKQ